MPELARCIQCTAIVPVAAFEHPSEWRWRELQVRPKEMNNGARFRNVQQCSVAVETPGLTAYFQLLWLASVKFQDLALVSKTRSSLMTAFSKELQ